MVELTNSLQQWQTELFNQTLKQELAALPPGTLPLHLGTTQGGIVDDSDISVTLLERSEEEGAVNARVGIFFREIIGGCSCGDDPPSENAYCEMAIRIDKATAQAAFHITYR